MRQQADQFVGPAVLQYVDRIALRGHRAARTEDVVARDVAGFVERAVVAGVEHHEARLCGQRLEVLEADDRLVALGLRVVVGLLFFEEGVGQVVFLLEILFGSLYVGFVAFAAFHIQGDHDLGLELAVLAFETVGLGRVTADVLFVGRTVLVEEHGIDLRAHQLVEHPVFHVIVHPEIELAQVSGLAGVGQREIFVDGNALVHPADQAVGVVSVAGVSHQIVELVDFAAFGDDFFQITGDSFVFVASELFGIADASRIEGRVEPLRRVAGEVEIEEQTVGRVAGDQLELQVRAVVVAVGGDRRLDHREILLVHLERRGQVLGIAHHGDRNVAHEDHAFERRAFGGFAHQRDELFAHLLGGQPVVAENVGRESVGLQGIAVGMNLGRRFVVGRLIDDDCERRRLFAAGLFDCDFGLQDEWQQQDDCQ